MRQIRVPQPQGTETVRQWLFRVKGVLDADPGGPLDESFEAEVIFRLEDIAPLVDMLVQHRTD